MIALNHRNEWFESSLCFLTSLRICCRVECYVIFLLKNGTINTPMLSEAIGVSTRTIKRELYILRDMHLIKYVGSNKTGHWEVVTG